MTTLKFINMNYGKQNNSNKIQVIQLTDMHNLDVCKVNLKPCNSYLNYLHHSTKRLFPISWLNVK